MLICGEITVGSHGVIRKCRERSMTYFVQFPPMLTFVPEPQINYKQ